MSKASCLEIKDLTHYFACWLFLPLANPLTSLKAKWGFITLPSLLSLQCMRILGARVHIFVLGRHLGFSNCEDWGEEIFAEGVATIQDGGIEPIYLELAFRSEMMAALQAIPSSIYVKRWLLFNVDMISVYSSSPTIFDSQSTLLTFTRLTCKVTTAWWGTIQRLSTITDTKGVISGNISFSCIRACSISLPRSNVTRVI